MKKFVKMSVAAAILVGFGSVSAQAADGIDLVSKVKVKGEVRPRYEMVDDSNTNSNANAFTNRLSIGVSADLFGTDWLSAYVEGTNISSLNDNYDDKSAHTANGHSVVVDADETRLTQSYIDIKKDKTLLRVGRQMINLDNQRFVGAVNWRQMPQTFDAYLLTNNSIDGLDLSAAYITQVNRVFGPDNAGTDLDTRTLLLNASYKIMPELKVTAYGYMIGEGTGGASGGSDTYGVSLTGDVAVNDYLKVNYRAEYAKQDDPTMENSGTSGNLEIDADYYNIELGMNISGILAGVGYESLSGDSDGAGKEKAFSTPLATGHKFNGWADKFLGTPTAGLEDISIMLGYKAKGFGVAKVIYHDFKSEVGSTDYGTEIDALYKNKIPGVKNLSGLLKFARYDADANAPVGALSTDTTKFWAMLTYKFTSK